MSTITFAPIPPARPPRLARVALMGAPFAGKSFTALMLAEYLAQGRPFGVLDTEGKADLLADTWPGMLVAPLTSYKPGDYLTGIKAAEQAGLAALVIDSFTDSWLDAQAAAQSETNTERGWGKVTLAQDKLYQAMRHTPLHLIVTLRTRERGKGREAEIVPICRADLLYEFDFWGLMLPGNTLRVTRAYGIGLMGREFPKPGVAFAKQFGEYLHVEPDDPVKAQKVAFAARVSEQFGQVGYSGLTGVADLLKAIKRKYDPASEEELLAEMAIYVATGGIT